jgi:hypothetical protein
MGALFRAYNAVEYHELVSWTQAHLMAAELHLMDKMTLNISFYILTQAHLMAAELRFIH